MTLEFRCAVPGCGFYLHADTEDEVVEHVRLHTDEMHGVWLRRAEARTVVRTGAASTRIDASEEVGDGAERPPSFTFTPTVAKD